MLFPFHNEFDELFRGNRSIWLKMAGAAAATDLIVLLSGALNAQPGGLGLGPGTIAIVLVVAAVAGAGFAILLSLKDIVARRRSAGRHVSWLLRLYFTDGVVSFMLWSVTATMIIVLGIIILFQLIRL